ncbi:MAG: glycosyltransferase family 39 protein [Pseudomonadaceae bacterium]|nr:glycosyltransferase family 39 protein [Pseudomonadaceae bacterium]
MVKQKDTSAQPVHVLEMLPWQAAAVWAAALLLARIIYVQWLMPYGLGPDEAQYWHWTSHMDWSYLTKPPLTTAAIAVGTGFFGETMLGVKIFALLGQSIVPLVGFAMAGMVAGVGAAWLAFWLLATVPLVAVGGLLMSPDALLLPLWMFALFILFLSTQQDKLKWCCWSMIGVLIGLAGLAKYTAALFYPLLLVFMLVERRDWLKQPQPYVAGLISLVLQAPVLWWNWQHDWAGLHHLLWQADGGGDGRHGGVGTLLEFLGGQLLVVGPLTFVLLLAVWGRSVAVYKRLEPQMRLLLWFTLPVFAVFALQTLNAKVQPNWPLLATVPALVLLAVLVAGRWRKLRPLLVAGIILNVLASLVMHDTFLLRRVGLETPYKADPTKDLRGWPEMGQLLDLQLARLAADSVVLTTRYQTAALAAFHTPRHPAVLYLNDGTRRANQYDLWPWPPLAGRLVLYINEQNVLPDAVKHRFSRCEPWQPLRTTTQGIITRQLRTWLCWSTEVAVR